MAHRIPRREFFKSSAKAGLALAGLGALPSAAALAEVAAKAAAASGDKAAAAGSAAGSAAGGASASAPAIAGKSQAWIVESAYPAEAVKKALELAGGMSKYVAKGERVVLKPNMGWARTPEYAANTNPDVMGELTRQCFAAGAKEVLILDATCNTAQRCYAMSGIAEACEAAGAKVVFTRESMMQKKPLNGEFLKDWEIIDTFLTADKIINVPIAKHHGISRVTLGMKNWMGAIGGNRGHLHQNIHVAVVDLAAFFKPALTVVDCTRVLMRGGPSSGDLSAVKQVNKIVISADPVAADALAAEFLDASPADLPFLKNATARGLGQWEKDKITVVTAKV